MSILLARTALNGTKRIAEESVATSLQVTREASSRARKPSHTSPAPSRTRLVKDLKPKTRDGGKLEVASRASRDTPSTPRPSPPREEMASRPSFNDESPQRRRKPGSRPEEPSRPAFTRDPLPHEGRTPTGDSSTPSSSHRRRPLMRDLTPITTPSASLSLKNWAARAHEERTERRATKRRTPRPVHEPLGDQFDTSNLEPMDELPEAFTSPPLLEGLLTCLKEILPHGAQPTPIQALSLKHLLKPTASPDTWRSYLLASETGSGKSIAYFLPLLQDLKRTEHAPRPVKQKRPINPRAFVLAPTHELSRQLTTFAKSLLHVSKLRVQCASRANTQSVARKTGTASRMASEFGMANNDDGSGGFTMRPGVKSRPVDLLVGTPNKLLEMSRGRGWDWEARARARRVQEGLDPEDADSKRVFWTEKPEMGLAGIEWVVVDEADVLFDPDFQEATRSLLSDIALARGHSVPYEPQSELDAHPSPVQYPFHLVLTTATIPSSLASYLDNAHPDMTRLASPHLHHLPKSLKTEYSNWTGGNRNSDIESRVRRVWAEDSLRSSDGKIGALSKILIFCNKRSKVQELSNFLEEKSIKNVALMGGAESRKHGSNHHLDGFLRVRAKPASVSSSVPATVSAPSAESKDPKKTAHVMITTSLLSRGLDFAPDIKHVFIVDEPRNMIDFLHRAGRSGRAGERGRVVIFGKLAGRGAGAAREVREKVRALKA